MSTILHFAREVSSKEQDFVIMEAEMYLKAASEAFAIMLVGSSLLTFLFEPAVYEDNAILRQFGYNNVCVGFDQGLGNIWGHFWYPLLAFFAIRFISEDTRRSSILRRQGDATLAQSNIYEAVVIFSNRFYAIALVVMNMTIIGTPPNQDKTADWTVQFHSAGYVLVLLSRGLTTVSATYKWGRKSTTAVYFSAFYAAVSLTLAVWYTSILFVQGEPFGPIDLLAALDWIWMICTVASSRILVQGPRIFAELTLVNKGPTDITLPALAPGRV